MGANWGHWFTFREVRDEWDANRKFTFHYISNEWGFLRN
jgi:hypothetical protein